MRFHALDYHKRRTREWNGGPGRSWRQPLHIGFWWHGVPRPTVRCWLFGHRPVVDGTTPSKYSTGEWDVPHLWVCCNRCGLRGHLQGRLDPGVYAVGDRYLGPWSDPFPPEDSVKYHKAFMAMKTDRARGYEPPGPIPRTDRGTLGGELVVGRNWSGLGFELKVGNAGSEHILAARLGFGVLGVLYLHTSDGWGQWVQRRLNPVGYDSRVISVDIGLDEARWSWWARRDNHDQVRESWWRNGGFHLRPLDRVFGRRRYEYEEVPGCVKVGRFVDLPEGRYMVALTLQRCTLGRRRGPKKRSWSVDWSALGKGLPTKGPESGRIFGSGVTVSGRSVGAGTWPAEAAARIALQITEDRTGRGWDPVALHTVQEVPA